MTEASVRAVAETTQSESVVEAGAAGAPVPGALVVFSGAGPDYRIVSMTPGVNHVVGREDLGGVPSADKRMSSQHAELRYVNGVFQVRDLSRNGTFLDGQRVDGIAEARSGAVLRLGKTVLLLKDDLRLFIASHVRSEKYVVGPQMQKVLDEAALARSKGRHLLIHGESGTGKEMVAEHYFQSGSPRRTFVPVNCANVQGELAVAAFFGSVKGAFTEAKEDRKGFLESAHDGVLFLDEIAELEKRVQPTLLRAVETGEVTRVGTTAPIRVNVGIVSASHADLAGNVAAGRFREDLYFRLAQFRVALPPLRERREEIPSLLQFALKGEGLELHASAVELALLRRWPGNVRELLSAARNAATAAHAASADSVRAEHFDAAAGRGMAHVTARDAGQAPPVAVARPDAGRPEQPAAPARAEPAAGKAGAGAYTRQQLVDALNAANWNVSVAARALNMNRTQLYREMERYGIARERDGLPAGAAPVQNEQAAPPDDE